MSYQTVIQADRPTSWWYMNDTTSTMADAIGRYNGSYAGSYTQSQPGPLQDGSAYSVAFDGSSGYAEVTEVFNTPEWSLEAWVYPTGTGGTNRILASNLIAVTSGGQFGTQLGINSTNQFLLTVGQSASPYGFTMAAGAATLSEWFHVIGTWDGTTLNFYLNGQLVGTAEPANVYPTISNLYLASQGGASPDYFPGRISEVAIYDYSLSAAQVANHYATAIAQPTPPFVLGVNGIQYMPPPNGNFLQANLNATANPNGTDTTVHFVYDTTPAFNATPVQTASTDIGSGSLPVTLTTSITNLALNQTYYYAVVATNAAGMVYSLTDSFVAQAPGTGPLTPADILPPIDEPTIVTPHFAWPLKMTNEGVAIVEQQTIDDIYGQVQCVVGTTQGELPAFPSFGIPDLTFTQAPINTIALGRVITNQVPDATLDLVTAALNTAQGDWQLTITTSANTTGS